MGIESLRHWAHERKIDIQYLAVAAIYGFVDLVKFDRVCINLVSNAIDFARYEVKVEIGVSEKELILRVSDDGPCIPDEFLPKLFQRVAAHGKSDGTGLGLAYARQIMRGHGGDVSYRRKDSLTIFECRLPHACASKGDASETLPILAISSAVILNCKRVTICLMPKELYLAVKAKLTLLKSENFSFSWVDQNSADIVVTNVDSILFRAMDNNKKVVHITEEIKESKILQRLTRHFHFS